ncbi:MAG: DUF1828 domain-containing protein [Tepidiforma sp.]
MKPYFDADWVARAVAGQLQATTTCKANGDELILDTPLTLPDLHQVRLYLVPAEDGDGWIVSDGGWTVEQLSLLSSETPTFRRRVEHIRAAARRAGLEFSDDELRMPSAATSALLAVAQRFAAVMSQTSLLHQAAGQERRRPHADELSERWERAGLVVSRRALIRSDRVRVRVSMKVSSATSEGVVEVIDGQTNAGLVRGIDRAVTRLSALSNSGYQGHLFAVYDEASRALTKEGLELLRVAVPAHARVIRVEEAATAIPRALAA